MYLVKSRIKHTWSNYYWPIVAILVVFSKALLWENYRAQLVVSQNQFSLCSGLTVGSMLNLTAFSTGDQVKLDNKKPLIKRLHSLFSEQRLNEYISHFETLDYDSSELHASHSRAKRSVTKDHHVNLKFKAHGKHFHIRLKRDLETFSDNLIVSKHISYSRLSRQLCVLLYRQLLIIQFQVTTIFILHFKVVLYYSENFQFNLDFIKIHHLRHCLC